MDFWLSQKECCGCAACQNACPVKAIEFRESADGFNYPDINVEKCINCGRCKSVCPVYNKKNLGHLKVNLSNREIVKVFSAHNEDDKIRFKSTSGGIFTTVAMYFLENDGVVFGAAYDGTSVKHTYVTRASELDKLRQSKYVQSEIGNNYGIVKDFLQKGTKVLWVGAPCQVSGLYEFLGKDDENLTTIEFICHGVNSPEVFQKWIKGIENKSKKQIQNVWFKYKDKGWRDSPFCTRVDFMDGTYSVIRKKDNLYMKGYLEGSFFLRESCHNCNFKGYDRSADLIIGDFWGITDDDNKGMSVIMVNSSKGNRILAEVKENLYLNEQKLEDVVKNNPRFLNSEPRNEKKDIFFKYIQQESFEKSIKKVLPSHKSFFYSVKRKIKKIYKHIRDN